jgi:small subunit ribosomal protein S16
MRLEIDRIKYWLSVGAQPSDRVAYLLWRTGLLPPPPITLMTKGQKKRGEEEKAKDGAAKA